METLNLILISTEWHVHGVASIIGSGINGNLTLVFQSFTVLCFKSLLLLEVELMETVFVGLLVFTLEDCVASIIGSGINGNGMFKPSANFRIKSLLLLEVELMETGVSIAPLAPIPPSLLLLEVELMETSAFNPTII